MTTLMSQSLLLKSNPYTEITPRPREQNSRKLSGYEFVNYPSVCIQSNSNGLIKYTDVVNYGRRISELNGHNCVMCGAVDVIIPTQNKDVCKSCDSSFWYSTKLNVAFKFCKGCKNFITLEMFSDKPDASKCCRCRRRGRENYLTKKFSDSNETPSMSLSTPSVCLTPFTPSSGCVHEEASVLASPTSLMNSIKALDSLRSGSYSFSTSQNVCTPAASADNPDTSPATATADTCSSSQGPVFDPSAYSRRHYKKRALSMDNALNPSLGSDSQAVHVQAEGNVRPAPKTPRPASCTLDATGFSVSADYAHDLKLSSFSTPGIKTVTPGSMISSHMSSGLSLPEVFRLSRSDSIGSTDGGNSSYPSLHSTSQQVSHIHEPASTSLSTATSQYLWDRACSLAGSPFVETAHSAGKAQQVLPSIRTLQATKFPTVRFADSNTNATTGLSLTGRSSPSNKEKLSERQEQEEEMGATARRHKPLFHDLYDPKQASTHADVTSAAGVTLTAANLQRTPSSSTSSRRQTGSSSDSELRRVPSQCSEQSGGPFSHSEEESEGHSGDSPRHLIDVSFNTDGSEEGVEGEESPVSSASSSGTSPRPRAWEWDPDCNPLMHLASMIPDHR